MNAVLSVSQINYYLKSIFDYDENLKNIYVTGEISNFTNHYRSGHFYFTLKDETSAIKAVMFRQYAQNIRFEPYDGLRVLVRCSVSVFERDGVYQLYVTDMQPDGLGELNLAYEQLKEKLGKEGLFSPEYKKPIPKYPERIAVVTSPTGAAVQDIINVISRRYPCCELMIVPVHVQGDQSAGEIVKALRRINLLKCADTIILGRGGGSIEDLWSFNEETVARAIFESEIPIISAVGHETDYTISDFVSDLRAPTPSAAAELATPDVRSLLGEVAYFEQAISKSVSDKISDFEYMLKDYANTLFLYSPENELKVRRDKISEYKTELEQTLKRTLERKVIELSAMSGKLDALSPLKTLARGYGVVFDENDKHVDSAKKLKTNQKIKLRMKDGSAICTVDEVTK